MKKIFILFFTTFILFSTAFSANEYKITVDSKTELTNQEILTNSILIEKSIADFHNVDNIDKKSFLKFLNADFSDKEAEELYGNIYKTGKSILVHSKYEIKEIHYIDNENVKAYVDISVPDVDEYLNTLGSEFEKEIEKKFKQKTGKNIRELYESNSSEDEEYVSLVLNIMLEILNSNIKNIKTYKTNASVYDIKKVNNNWVINGDLIDHIGF